MTHRGVQPEDIVPPGCGDFIRRTGIDQKRHLVPLTNTGHSIGHGVAVSATDHNHPVLGDQFFGHRSAHFRTTGIVFYN